MLLCLLLMNIDFVYFKVNTYVYISLKDITDLFGADLPVDGGKKGEFEWRDGPLIQALKKGDWILLDEVSSIFGVMYF